MGHGLKFVLLAPGRPSKSLLGYGAVAQLIERVVRNDEVVGLIPICSTILRSLSSGWHGQSSASEAVRNLLATDLQPRLALGSFPAEWWGVKPGEQLCLACGMCCDGTLFGHVRLGPGDDAKKLKALGLPVSVSRSQPPVARFRQPCAALCADRTCRVYTERPGQCRTFECGVFKDAEVGRIKFSTALRLVKQGRQLADKVRQLLRKLGNPDEPLSLSERFSRTQQRMEQGITDQAARDAFGELSLAMHDLNLLTHDKFYTKADAQ